MKRKVFILNSDQATDEMFRQCGWEITKRPSEADMFQFTGSGDSDVSPELYREAPHRMTKPDRGRDKMEGIYYQLARKSNIPMAGICRGAQFLNVMNGGWLWQHVNGHNKPHYITDQLTGESYLVSSIHHQQMRVPQNKAIVLATAGESTFREWCSKDKKEGTVCINPKKESDVEVVLFPETKCLCVQYHPEYPGWSALAARYFDMIEHNLFSKN
jgi:gamma-glutamyl-gamma-aminobutyrate hydrolase PuuD